MEQRVAPFPRHLANYQILRDDTSSFAAHFASVMREDRRFEGARLLDIGCGEHFTQIPDRNGNEIYAPILLRARQIDGVEPGGDISKHPNLTERWQSTLEGADLPVEAYDVMVSFNVLEHVEHPVKFLEAAYRALKPGGVFYATTPHGRHPFSMCVRLVQGLGLKSSVADREYEGKIQRIPTYYRLNTRAKAFRAAEAAGFARGTFYVAPAVNWESYFPSAVRFLPRAYDRLIGCRVEALAQQMMVVLEKAPLAGGGST